MVRLNVVDYVALVLLIVGGLNWGLVAFANLDLVATLFGSVPVVAKLVYGLVALAAVYAASWFVRERTPEYR